MAREVLGDYLSAVGAQIRWRRARGPLLRELADHIHDQAADYRAQGLEEGAALERAVAEMGAPETVGRDLDRLHRPQNRWGLALVFCLMALAGVAIQFAAYQATGQGMMDLYARQAAWVPVALAILCGVWLSDCTLLLRRGWAAGLMVLTLLAAVLLTNGTARPWGLYLSLLLPVLYAAMLCRRRDRGGAAGFIWGLAAWLLPLPALLVPSVSAYLLSGGAMSLVLVAAAELGWFAGKRRSSLFLSCLPTLLCLGGGLLWLSRRGAFGQRMDAFLHPERYLDGGGYLFFHLRRGADAGFWGNALDNTDLMLTFLAQQTGRWLFPLAALLLVLAACFLLRLVGRLQSRTGRLLAFAALLPLLLQGGLYILFDMGCFPIGPLSLPFLSHGVGYLTVNCVLAGALLSVFRMDALLRDGPGGGLSCAPPARMALRLPLGKGKLLIEYHKTP